jgi:hypothetical protein
VHIGGPAAAAVLLVALAVGCSGSEPPTDIPPSPSPSATPTELPHRGGLVGAIDSARLLAVCENVRLAATVVESGLSDRAVTSALDGVIDALRQPPQSAALRATAAHWTSVRRRAGDAKTVRRLQAFCDREGG